jgi:hypothetical protein
MQVRKVDASGRLSFKNHLLKVGKAFIRENLGRVHTIAEHR